MAGKGYKVLLIDADPQCNLTFLALGIMKYQDKEITKERTIYNIFDNTFQ
jgi:chromosome partitioning protein